MVRGAELYQTDAFPTGEAPNVLLGLGPRTFVKFKQGLPIPAFISGWIFMTKEDS